MRLANITLMAITLAASAPARPASDPVVTVYVRDNASVPMDQLAHARDLAKRMFASIGVEIDWRSGLPPVSSADASIAIELVNDTPATLMPGALAYAKPYEGVHIQVFYDRIQRGPCPTERLAHVLVHEITHILQGIARHSATGVMKAQWTWQDVRQMRDHPLAFTEADVILIHQGMLARRSGNLPLTAGLTQRREESPVR